MDGWTGDEVADLPLCVFEYLAKLYQQFEASGLVPTQWTWCKQVHLPKNEAASDCKDFRPVAIMSIFYRIWSSARFKEVATQQWVDRWLPAQAVCDERNLKCGTP